MQLAIGTLRLFINDHHFFGSGSFFFIQTLYLGTALSKVLVEVFYNDMCKVEVSGMTTCWEWEGLLYEYSICPCTFVM